MSDEKKPTDIERKLFKCLNCLKEFKRKTDKTKITCRCGGEAVSDGEFKYWGEGYFVS